LPSAIAGSLAVGTAAALGWVVGGLRVALVTAAWMAVAPFQVRYSQEARMYSAMACSAGLTTAAMLWLLQRPQAVKRPLWRVVRAALPGGSAAAVEGDRAVGAAWLVFGAGTVVTLYLHNTSPLFVAACLVAVVGWIASEPGDRGLRLWRWFVVYSIAGLCYAVWVPTLLDQAQGVQQHFWKEFPTPQKVIRYLHQVYLYSRRSEGWALAFAAPLAAGIWALRHRPRTAALLLWMAVAAPLLLWLVSLKESIFLQRLMIWGPLPAYALGAAWLGRVRPPAVAIAVAVASLAGGSLALRRYYAHDSKPPWRKLATELDEVVQPGDVLVASTHKVDSQLRYYLQRRTDPIGGYRLVKARRGRLPPSAARADSIVLVSMVKPRGRLKERRERLLTSLQRDYLQTYRRDYGRRMQVWRFERRGGSMNR
jgi:hypothetical protein